jgi:hypothetical protein
MSPSAFLAVILCLMTLLIAGMPLVKNLTSETGAEPTSYADQPSSSPSRDVAKEAFDSEASRLGLKRGETSH